MKQKTILLTIFVLLLLGGGYFFLSRESSSLSSPTPSPVESVDTIENTKESSARYMEYSKKLFEEASDKKRVHFFHASWCPTCKTANRDFSANGENIPEDVVVFKTDYDTSTDLKKRYSITYQHTFVQVDAQGNEITKWNGGGVDELVANLK